MNTYNFEINNCWGKEVTEKADPFTEDLYIVEEIVTFKNCYLVKAPDAEEAATIVELDVCGSFFQKQVSTGVSSVTKVKSDSDVVNVLVNTEQPEMTLAEFTQNRADWYRNCTNV